MTPRYRHGRARINVTTGGKRVTVPVCRLVLLAFRGEPQPGQISRHIDGDVGNDRLENLEWVTHVDPRHAVTPAVGSRKET